MVRRAMGSAASSEKADEQLLEEMEVRVVTGAGVYGYEVTGAGNPVVNGVYVRGGLANLDVGLKPYYEHFEQPGLWLVRYSGGWCIVHEDKLDELWDGGDYYRQLDGDDTRLPPLFGCGRCASTLASSLRARFDLVLAAGCDGPAALLGRALIGAVRGGSFFA